MSSNVVDYRQGTTRRHTVAELLARERGTVTAVGRADAGHARGERLPAADLLRREGFDFADFADAPTQRFAPVAVATVDDAPPSVPPTVPPALRGEAGRQKEEKPKGHGTTTMSRALVLCGLTVAGLIAMKPSIASSPMTEAPEDQNRALSAQQGERQGNAPEFLRTGVVTPTTVAATMMLDETSDAASSERGNAGSGSASSGAGGDTAGSNSAAPAPTADAARTTAPQSSERRGQERSASAPDRGADTDDTSDESGSSSPDSSVPDNSEQAGDDAGQDSGAGGSGHGDHDGDRDQDGLLDSLDPVLDPVTGTISGVLELGGGLLGR